MEAEPVGFLFFLTLLNWVSIKTKSLFQSCIALFRESSVFRKQVEASSASGGSLRLSREEVEIVMGRIGMFFSGEEKEDEMDSEEISSMFEEKGPSIEEVRQSFSVFDENCDGFIDAGELQRLLSRLEFSEEGMMGGLEECQRMITTHDENRDGFIDFDEFVKLLQSSFS